MGTEKPRTAGHDRNGLGTFSHGGFVLIGSAQVYQQELMANDESRISKGIANRAVAPAVLSGIRTPGECAEDTSPYSIRASSFFRHSTFGIRHLINPMRI